MTVSGRINQEDSLLAISEFAQCSAILPLHADRVFPLLRKTATVNDHCSVRLSEIRGHQLLMAFQNPIIVPSPFADKLLYGSYGIEIFTTLTQDHRFNTLPLEFGELSAQIQLRPFALFAARKQRRVLSAIAAQFRRQPFSFSRSQIPAGRLSARWRTRISFCLSLGYFAQFVLQVEFATGSLSKINVSL